MGLTPTSPTRGEGHGIAWPVALGAVFLSGVAFLVLTAAGVRRMIVSAIPTNCTRGGGGIGLFIALIGFPQRRI